MMAGGIYHDQHDSDKTSLWFSKVCKVVYTDNGYTKGDFFDTKGDVFDTYGKKGSKGIYGDPFETVTLSPLSIQISVDGTFTVDDVIATSTGTTYANLTLTPSKKSTTDSLKKIKVIPGEGAVAKWRRIADEKGFFEIYRLFIRTPKEEAYLEELSVLVDEGAIDLMATSSSAVTRYKIIHD